MGKVLIAVIGLVIGIVIGAFGAMTLSGGAPTTSCPAGVKREGSGSAMVTVAKPDGGTRTIFFQNGRAAGYDQSQADTGKFSATKQGDLNIIHIGQERYEFPDALPFGG